MKTAVLNNANTTRVFFEDDIELTQISWGGLAYVVCESEAQLEKVLAGSVDFDDVNTVISLTTTRQTGEFFTEQCLRNIQNLDNADLIIGRDCEGYLFQINDESYDFVQAFHYHDGNNWRVDEVTGITTLDNFKIIKEIYQIPAYYFEKLVKIDDEYYLISESNISGHITPYWTYSDPYHMDIPGLELKLEEELGFEITIANN